ncbi:MAG: hypothetical protein RL519_1793 [Pseudomonadota bacterium]
MKKTTISGLKASAAPLVLGLSLISTAAAAQSNTSQGDETASPSDAIVVTGSRIARPNIEAPSPVTVVSQEQIQLAGTTTVETLLNELPMVIPGNTRVSNNAGGQNFSTLDLRGLGPQRTLILLDGERLPASSTSGVVDIAQIPTGLIKRVDVVTGGATAVYGSDAIAGVVNFVLNNNYQGMELTAQSGISEGGKGFNYNFSGMFGSNFADGRGNLTVYASYTRRNAVGQGEMDYSRISGAIFTDASGNAVVVDDPAKISAGYSLVSSGGSGTPPWGWVTNSSANPFRNLSTLLPATFGAADTDCNSATPGVAVNTGSLSFNSAGRLTPRFTAGQCAVPVGTSSRYSFADQNYLITPYDRFSVTALGHYELNDTTTFKYYSSFTAANQTVNLAPTPATGIVVPANSPLIPADLATALASRANPTADFIMDRRFFETGPRVGKFHTDAKNIRGVIESKLNDDWTASVVIGYGRVDNVQRGIGNINKTAVAQGLRGCPTGSLPGCIPINIFGANTLTAPMLSFVRIDTQQQSTFEQSRAAANLVGSLGKLPGGPIGIATGVEIRKDSGLAVVDDAQRTGNIYGFNAVQGLQGSITVKEAYGEIRLPILTSLSIGAGARYSDYSTVGGLFNWKVESEFQPVSQIKLRATYNRAARAPNVFELFQNGDQGFPSYTDPCRDAPARTAAILARCQAAAPLANFTGFTANNSQVQAFSFGNPNLSEEKAETWTVGSVITPGRVLGGNLTATVDYYNITLNNRVASLGAAYFISQCYNSGDASACARIARDPSTGQINSVNTTVTNGSTPYKTSGIDFGLDWATDILGGNFSISDVLTYVAHYKIGTSEYADTVFSGIGGVTPKWANTLTATYRRGKVTTQARYVWKKGAKQNFPGAELEGLFTGDGRIPSLNLVNLSVKLAITDNFEITGIANNVLNKLPPQTPTGIFEQANTNISFYDPYALGRDFMIQARVRF